MRSLACLLAFGALVSATLAAQARDLVLVPQVPQGRRLALVIGNDTYVGSPLVNARTDARTMAQALRRLSFDVTTLEDGTRASIGSAVRAFGGRLTASDLALVFYAGHGVQVENVNYLIPVDFTGRSEDEVRADAVSADEVTRALRRARIAVLVLDACRNNPFSGQRAGGGGLAPVDARGLLVAYSAGAGETAGDGPVAQNGIYTGELVQVLGTPGLGLRETFFEVQRRVQARTQGRQFPAIYSQLVDDVVLTPGTATTALATSPPPVTSASDLAFRAELELWDAIKDSRSVVAFEDYLKRYPSGQFHVPVEERLRAARAAASPATAPRPMPASTAGSEARRAGETRSDPRVTGVQWAYIPAGTFEMGCTPSDTQCEADESPRHSVTITRGFELMTTEMTLGMTKAVGRTVPRQPTWSREDHPVVNINWDEATALCGAIGGRLPTEAEWEYAARGGLPASPFPWGAETPAATPAIRNGARFSSGSTTTVASFAPNGYGLHDMAGNVAEWAADGYGPYSSGMEYDPRGHASGSWRVLRGESWSDKPRNLRVSNRDFLKPAGRGNYFGVRCARD